MEQKRWFLVGAIILTLALYFVEQVWSTAVSREVDLVLRILIGATCITGWLNFRQDGVVSDRETVAWICGLIAFGVYLLQVYVVGNLFLAGLFWIMLVLTIIAAMTSQRIVERAAR